MRAQNNQSGIYAKKIITTFNSKMVSFQYLNTCTFIHVFKNYLYIAKCKLYIYIRYFFSFNSFIRLFVTRYLSRSNISHIKKDRILNSSLD